MGLSSNRHTQLNMLALAGTKPVNPSLKIAGPQGLESSGQTLQRNVPNKKRARSPEEDALKTEPETGKETSRLDRFRLAGTLRLRAAWGSPWEQYEKIYDLEIPGPVEVAVRKADPIELVHVRTFTKPGAEKALHMFQHIQHHNIVTALDAFTTDDGLYVVLEPMSISLERIVKSPAYPNERQLAAILGQVSSVYDTKVCTDHNRS
jgi:serine/threonine protein kinase